MIKILIFLFPFYNKLLSLENKSIISTVKIIYHKGEQTRIVPVCFEDSGIYHSESAVIYGKIHPKSNRPPKGR